MTELIIKVDDDFLREAKLKGMEEQYELIRCKDCIHASVLLDEYDNDCGYACNITYDAGGFWLEVEKDHFCGYGERGDSDDE